MSGLASRGHDTKVAQGSSSEERSKIIRPFSRPAINLSGFSLPPEHNGHYRQVQKTLGQASCEQKNGRRVSAGRRWVSPREVRRGMDREETPWANRR